MAVPTNSIVSFAGVDRVYTVKNNALEDKVVKTGRHLKDERIEVTDGLKDGDLVVTNANEKMAKGQKVRMK
jgi:multidrug efflux pump subunit AcrA (membrane-fusion protein)